MYILVPKYIGADYVSTYLVSRYNDIPQISDMTLLKLINKSVTLICNLS